MVRSRSFSVELDLGFCEYIEIKLELLPIEDTSGCLCILLGATAPYTYEEIDSEYYDSLSVDTAVNRFLSELFKATKYRGGFTLKGWRIALEKLKGVITKSKLTAFAR